MKFMAYDGDVSPGKVSGAIRGEVLLEFSHLADHLSNEISSCGTKVSPGTAWGTIRVEAPG